MHIFKQNCTVSEPCPNWVYEPCYLSFIVHSQAYVLNVYYTSSKKIKRVKKVYYTSSPFGWCTAHAHLFQQLTINLSIQSVRHLFHEVFSRIFCNQSLRLNPEVWWEGDGSLYKNSQNSDFYWVQDFTYRNGGLQTFVAGWKVLKCFSNFWRKLVRWRIQDRLLPKKIYEVMFEEVCCLFAIILFIHIYFQVMVPMRYLPLYLSQRFLKLDHKKMYKVLSLCAIHTIYFPVDNIIYLYIFNIQFRLGNGS